MKKEERLQDYNKIINFIIEEIDNGKLIEGSRLPSERELTEMLETSRNSTREAISILRGMGLVESRFISRAVGTELAENGISQEYEEQLERITESMRDASDEEFCRLDREFHLTLINATENILKSIQSKDIEACIRSMQAHYDYVESKFDF